MEAADLLRPNKTSVINLAIYCSVVFPRLDLWPGRGGGGAKIKIIEPNIARGFA